MFRNYVKVAIRSFLNQKYYSLINTLGLALGTAACILILLFVQDELSYEKSFQNNEQIYRLVQDFPMGDHLSQSATVPFPNKNAMLADFPEIKDAAIIYRPSSWGNVPTVKFGEDIYLEDEFIFAENSFLKMYGFNLIKGDPETALKGPNQLLVTESTAKKYFGNEDPIGKTLNFNNFRNLEVIGVIQDLPRNTHLEFDMVGSFETFKTFFGNNQAFFDTQWVWVAAWLYFTVEDENDLERIAAQLPEYTKKHYPEVLVESGVALHIQKANDVHLTSSLELEFESNGSIYHVYLFSTIAILILLIAIINFMNLATSRSAKRAKEVGLRKVMGAHKKMLVTQFMGEAVLTSFLALIVALVLISVSMPWFNQLTGKEITLDFLGDTGFVAVMVLFGGFVGVLAGSYPALILSSYKPTDVLKGKSAGLGANFLRKILVVTQFVVSISLIICIGIVYNQLNYIQNKDLGFNQEQIMMADLNFNFFNQYPGFKNTLMQSSDIVSVALMGGSIPGDESVIENAFVPAGKPIEEQNWFSAFFAGHDFEKVIDVEFLQGHSFRIGNSEDSIGYIINETAAKVLGWEEDVVGRELDRMNSGNVVGTGKIIGLVKDFHYRPLYDPIKPLVIMLGGGTMSIKIQSNDLQSTIAKIEDEWNKTFAGNPFRYSFMDDNFDSLYKKENKLSQTVQYFSALAIFIACLGLLGLSSFTAENRRKEIGIRKVNGATLIGLLALLTKDFSKLILVAFLISAPLAYYFGNMWLNNFAYRTNISLSIFVIAGVSALLVATLTVSYHTIKAAMTNPINSLRYE